MVLGLLDQLQIFSQLYLIELLELLTGLGLLELWHLIYPRLLTGFDMLVFFTSQIFGVVSLFLSNRWLRVVLDGKSSQEYPLNAGVLQGSILGPAIFYYTLMTFVTMLYVTMFVDRGRSGLLISVLEKLSWFRLTGIITMVLFM